MFQLDDTLTMIKFKKNLNIDHEELIQCMGYVVHLICKKGIIKIAVEIEAPLSSETIISITKECDEIQRKILEVQKGNPVSVRYISGSRE